MFALPAGAGLPARACAQSHQHCRGGRRPPRAGLHTRRTAPLRCPAVCSPPARTAAGLGRAPATALAYMWWFKGWHLEDAYEHLTGEGTDIPRGCGGSVRECEHEAPGRALVCRGQGSSRAAWCAAGVPGCRPLIGASRLRAPLTALPVVATSGAPGCLAHKGVSTKPKTTHTHTHALHGTLVSCRHPPLQAQRQRHPLRSRRRAVRGTPHPRHHRPAALWCGGRAAGGPTCSQPWGQRRETLKRGGLEDWAGRRPVGQWEDACGAAQGQWIRVR